MNQLNKLIQQYETENPGKKAKPQYMTSYDADFVEFLASRPTCGKEQRLFLDEIEKLGDLTDSELSFVSFDDFDCDIDEVIKGK